MLPARGNKKKGSAGQGDKYWQRLRKEFETCQYNQSGAYGAYNGIRTEGMAEVEARIDRVEVVIKSQKFKRQLDEGGFNDRLSRVYRYGRKL